MMHTPPIIGAIDTHKVVVRDAGNGFVHIEFVAHDGVVLIAAVVERKRLSTDTQLVLSLLMPRLEEVPA